MAGRPRERMHPERSRRRRDELLEQLRGLFLAEGFLAFSLADLAERLRCSKTTLYLVAPTKEQIVVATVRSWLKGAAERVEATVAGSQEAADRLEAYMRAVSTELAPASPAFYADLAAFAPAGEVYRQNTRYAAARVQELVDDGVRDGSLRAVHAGFVGAAVAQVMAAIQGGDISAATGLDDAAAYEHLADLVARGVVARPGA